MTQKLDARTARLEADIKVLATTVAEHDRRYTELNVERERALEIRDAAAAEALELARTIQTYKDEKANELREQINSERGLYATKGDLVAVAEKVEATLRPIQEYVASDRGRGAGSSALWGYIVGAIGVLVGLAGLARQFGGL